jgi:hypothetical protein
MYVYTHIKCGRNVLYPCMVNGKMIPVETIPGMGGEGDKGE